jgi:hypothetical protein
MGRFCERLNFSGEVEGGMNFVLRTIVTQAEYAKLKNREPSSVSKWIAEGKISKAALIGEGVRAQIWVEQAEKGGPPTEVADK